MPVHRIVKPVRNSSSSIATTESTNTAEITAMCKQLLLTSPQKSDEPVVEESDTEIKRKQKNILKEKINHIGLQHAQKALLDAYILMSNYDVFATRYALNKGEVAAYGDGIQDVFGTLYTILIIIRIIPIQDINYCSQSGSLALTTRLQLAAVITCGHKLCSGFYKSGSNIVVHALQKLLYIHELPRSYVEWEQALQRHNKLEFDIMVVLPGISLVADTPFYYLDLLLNRLVFERTIDDSVAILLRGGAFFFIGAAACNPEFDTLSNLLKSVGTKVLGESLCVVLTSCYAASLSPRRRYKFRLSDTHERVALILLSNSLTNHAARVKIGAYTTTRFKLLFDENIAFVHGMFKDVV